MQNLVKLLLKKNKIAFDKAELEFQIKSHPSYPSLHAITGVLGHFNISNVAAKIPNTKEVIEDLPSCFIAQLNINGHNGLFTIEKKEGLFNCFDELGKHKAINTDKFLEAFTGIILAVEQTDNTATRKEKPRINSSLYVIIASLCLLLVYVNSVWDIMPITVFLLSVVGILISVSILQQELGIKNPIGEAFCTSNSDKKNCHAVLASNGARFFGNKKLSDLSMMYFTGYSLAVFLLSIQGYSLNLVYAISLLALPITLYSIYYQGVVLKTWCLLCLSIVALLWIQAVIPLAFQSFSFSNIAIVPIEILIVLSAFIISYALWSCFKPEYEASIQNKHYKIDYFKFKKDYTVFSSLLKQGSQIETQVEGSQDIIFGNPNSNVEILIVTNPFCGHCKPVHSIIEDVLSRYADDVKIIIRFNINLSDLESDAFKIVSSILHFYKTNEIEKCKQAMHDAYSGMHFKDWEKKWGNLAIDKETYHEILKQQKDWCTNSGLNFTPVILINGYAYPRVYDRKDLIFFIEDLSEAYNNTNN